MAARRALVTLRWKYGEKRLSEVTMAWLLRDGEVLASLDATINQTSDVRRGLVGELPDNGAVMCSPARWTHSIGASCAMDVAFLDEHLAVIDTVRVQPFRIVFPRRKARSVLQARAGAFERWNLRRGDKLEVRS